MFTRRHYLRSGLALSLVSLGMSASAQEVLRIALGDPRYLPLYDPGRQSGEGIFCDVFREVLQRRMKITPIYGLFPWARAQAMVKSGEQDAICTLATKDRLEYAIASKVAVVSLPERLFVRADNPRLAEFAAVRSVEDVRKMKPRIIGYVGNNWVLQQFPGMGVDMGGDFDSAVGKLVLGRGDVMIDDAYSLQDALKKQPGGDKVIMLPQDIDQTDYKLLVNKAAPFAQRMAEFDHELARFKKEAHYTQILAKYGVTS